MTRNTYDFDDAELAFNRLCALRADSINDPDIVNAFLNFENPNARIIGTALNFCPELILKIDASLLVDAHYRVALDKDIDLFSKLNNLTSDLCEFAVRRKAQLLLSVPVEFLTEELLWEAVDRSHPIIGAAMIFKVADEESLSEDFLTKLIRLEPTSIRYLKSRQNIFANLAVKMDGETLQYIRYKTNNLRLTALRQTSKAIQFFDLDIDDPIFKEAVKINSWSLYLLNNPPYELCEIAVRTNWRALKAVPLKHLDEKLCCLAYEQNPLALRYLWQEVGLDDADDFRKSTDEITMTDQYMGFWWDDVDSFDNRQVQSFHTLRQLEYSLQIEKIRISYTPTNTSKKRRDVL